jgi:hypothetical protein
MESLNDYLNNFFDKENEGNFCLPEIKTLYMSDIKKFLNNYKLSSTFIGIGIACRQLEILIENAEEVIYDLNENITQINNPTKISVYMKAIEKSTKKEKKVA